jgi:hypothetical protein
MKYKDSISMAGRFFSFGCSFTEYSWPTWANILAHTFKQQGIECYNYGRSGTGNYAIFNTMIKADLRHKFTADDIIMVMWSSWSREDRWFSFGGWGSGGNVLNNPVLFDQNFIEKYWCLENDVISNICSISSAQRLFNITFEARINASELRVDSEQLTDPLLTKFLELSSIKSDNTLLSSTNKMSDFDTHPLPLQHLHFIQTVIEKQTEFKISTDTIKWVEQIESEMMSDFESFLIDISSSEVLTPRMAYSSNLQNRWYKNMSGSWGCSESFASVDPIVNKFDALWHRDEFVQYLEQHQQLFR